MKSKLIATLAGALLSLAALPALTQEAKDWVDIKDPQELRALYSNKTFKGKDWMDRPWVGHYRPDGRGVMLFEGARIPRTWQVTGNDQVCIKADLGSPCFRFQRHAAKPGTYRSINVVSDMKAEFSVEDGVPQF